MEKKSPLVGLVSGVLLGDDHGTVQCDAEGRVLGRCRDCNAPGIVLLEPPPDQARIKRLEIALEFYANFRNWDVPGVERHRKYFAPAERDAGDIARAALDTPEEIACTMLPDQSGTWCGRKVVDGETVFSVPATDGPIKNCRVCIASMCRPWLRHAKSRKETV